MAEKPVQLAVRPLRQQEVARVRLPWDSRFNPTTLAGHLGEYPGFALWNPASGEYAVGGYWRGRRDIGMIMETSKGATRGPLVEALLNRFRERALVLAVLSQDEVEAATAWYRDHSWAVLDRLLVYRLPLSQMNVADQRSIPVSVFQPQDIDSLIDLDRVAFPWLWQNEPSDFLAYAALPNVSAFVARLGRRLLGYVSYSTVKARGHLDRLAVDPRFRREGLGSALLAMTLKRMQDCGVLEVGLTTQQQNHSAQELYRSHGFVRTGEVHEIYGLKLSGAD